MSAPVSIKNKIIKQEYQIAATTSATSAQQLTFPTSNNDAPGMLREVIIAAKGADITFAFGNSSVSASTTATNNALPPENFTLLTGAIYSVQLSATQNYVSVKTATGSGTAIIQLTTQDI